MLAPTLTENFKLPRKLFVSARALLNLKLTHILLNFSILFSNGGCVWKISEEREGLARNNGAIEPETFISEFDFIFSNARINPVGVRVNFTAEESAAYSLFLEIANWTNIVTIGARMARTIPIIMKIAPELFLLLLPPLNELHHKLLKNIWEIIEIMPTRIAVSVMNLMS